jgi:hypothetical protein
LLSVVAALIIGSPGFTAFAFVLALLVMLITWFPAGFILRIAGINKTIIPKSLKVFVSWVAFLGLIATMHPDLISFKSLCFVALLWLFLMGITAKINLLDKIIFPLVILMCFVFAWEKFFPDDFRSTVRYLSSNGKLFSAWKDRSSIDNEANSATTFGFFQKDINVLYEAEDDKPFNASTKEVEVSIPYGTLIKVFNHKEEISLFEGQGFLRIQLAKENGSFVRGKKYWVEAELVRLATPREVMEQEEARRCFVADSIRHAEFFARMAERRFIVRNPGTYIIDLAVNEKSLAWDSIPAGCSYGFERGTNARFQVIYPDGMIMNSWDGGKLPSKYRFKIINLNEERPRLVVKRHY